MVRRTSPVRKMVASIKEIVGNHSECDIYAILKESNMDPNETAQKLLNQDPFHEVKRKKDKKKEASTQSTKQTTKSHTFPENNTTRPPFFRNSLPGISCEFRIVRDNRVNQNNSMEAPTSLQSSNSANVRMMPNDPGKRSMRNLIYERQLGPRHSEGQKSSQALRGSSNTSNAQVLGADSNGPYRKGLLEKGHARSPSSASQLQGQKSHNSQLNSSSSASNSSLIGSYFSSSDPVHVPSGYRSSGVGKRDVGVVGFRRSSIENSAKHSSIPSSSFATSLLGKDTSASTGASKSDQLIRTTVSGSIMSSIPINRSYLNNQYAGKPHQVLMGHQKASQPNMEWKPKSSKKSSFMSPGFIERAAPPISPPKEISMNSKTEADHLQQNFTRANTSEKEHVIIPQHLRVPEAERTHLTFGSFGMEFNLTKGVASRLKGIENAEQSNGNPSIRDRAPSVSNEDAGKLDLRDGQVSNSRSDSPASAVVSEHPLPGEKSLTPGTLESYADVGLIRNDSSYAPAEPQKEQYPAGLPSFSAYDPQTGYDMPFFRPAMDESMRGQGLPSPGEALSSHVANSIPASTVAMLQQPVPQLYSQVHVSHFPNFLPYRQFLPQVYGPPMAVPAYSGNPAYPHPSSGSSYLVMQGGSAHLAAGGLKYGASQYKPISAGTPTGFGTYTNQSGYAINGQGTIGSATGVEDSTRMKYKDGNLYTQNPQQAETQEFWIQTPRELPGLQSASYYNIAGQVPHTAAYLPSHTGRTSFNATPTAPPTHLQFPGLYHPSQQATIANPHHHMGPGMGGNVGVGVAAAAASPGAAQVGAYQQPQVGHLNWSPNF